MNKDVLEEVIKKDLEEIIRVETLKKIRSIFEQMQIIRHTCYIDSLARIDEEIYDCDNCILADTIDVKRDDIMGREICPLDVKGDIYALRWIIKK